LRSFAGPIVAACLPAPDPSNWFIRFTDQLDSGSCNNGLEDMKRGRRRRGWRGWRGWVSRSTEMTKGRRRWRISREQFVDALDSGSDNSCRDDFREERTRGGRRRGWRGRRTGWRGWRGRRGRSRTKIRVICFNRGMGPDRQARNVCTLKGIPANIHHARQPGAHVR